MVFYLLLILIYLMLLYSWIQILSS